MDFEQSYRAMETRDESQAGEFFAAVTSTGIYCRPGMPGANAEARERALLPHGDRGSKRRLRACLRCHPDECD
jgi:methylphosphotriester-DNA--protein-cysteine methyltransferase